MSPKVKFTVSGISTKMVEKQANGAHRKENTPTVRTDPEMT